MEQCAWVVDFYLDARGRNPVLDFVDGLAKQEQAKIFRVLKLLQEYGPLQGGIDARPIAGMWELRISAERIFYFAYTGQRVILLHGYHKQSQKAPKREIETARRRMAEFMERGQ